MIWVPEKMLKKQSAYRTEIRERLNCMEYGMLTEKKIKAMQPQDKQYYRADSHGLGLLVTPSGGKLWRFNYKFGGKQKTLALGQWPVVTLQEAREKALACKRKLYEGEDPGVLRKPSVSQFSVLAVEWLEKKDVSERRRKQLGRCLVRDVLPRLGTLKVEKVSVKDVDEVLQAILKDRGVCTAHTCKGIIGAVFSVAVRRGYVQYNPVLMLAGALPSQKHVHHPALTDVEDLRQLFATIDSLHCTPVMRLYLRLLPLLFTRPSELRLAQWQEVNFEEKMWTVPAERTKMRRELLVPLARQTIELLQELHRLTGHQEWLFLSQNGKPFSETAVQKLFRKYFSGRQSAHGFRATARTCLHERLECPPDAIEAQLGHRVPDRLGSAYNRALHLLKRISMMQSWADFLDAIRAGYGKAAVS